MSTITDPADVSAGRPLGPPLPPQSGLDALFGRFWPEPVSRVAARPRLLLAAGLVALAGAVLLPGRPLGLGWWLVLLAGGAVVGHPLRLTARPADRALGALAALALAVIVLRDADWVVALALVAAFALGTAALSRAETASGMVIAPLVAPLAALRGLPWLSRSLRAWRRTGVDDSSGGPPLLPVLRALAVAAILVVVIGALFASGDAAFARSLRLVRDVLPAGRPDEPIGIFVGLVTLVVGGIYLAVNPPRVDRCAPAPARAVRRFEWLIPVGGVVGVLTAFLLTQVGALFGGHGYLRGRSGLTYAAYVHQGFGQLTAVTVIVLLVVAVVLRRAPRVTAADRALLRGGIGLLCGLALVVLASALNRLALYEQAYGYTRLRLLVGVFELWLGVVLLLAMTAGVWLRARWMPRVALLCGALALLTTAAANPDALIARHNVDRLQTTGHLDWVYLQQLSDDAVPAIDRLPEPYRSCALADRPPTGTGLLDWNLGRSRAIRVLGDTASAGGVDPVCFTLPSR